MNDRNNHPTTASLCSDLDLGQRLRLIRIEAFGAASLEAIALAIGVPLRTWSNYEAGVMIPGHILLQFQVITRVEPRWLLTGSGPRYRPVRDETEIDRSSVPSTR